MSRVSSLTSASVSFEWIERNQEQIKIHPAWHGHISETDSEELLKSKNAFTYLLRAGEKEDLYYISFVKEDGAIKHQFFVLEFDRLGWVYRNGGVQSHKDLNQLIPMMLHCDTLFCTPLSLP